MASTYLFVGPKSVGKRLFAERLATLLLCSRPDGMTPCGHCDSCRLIQSGNHPDLLRVELPEGRSSLPLEFFLGKPEARGKSGLCHDLALKPLIGSRRVAIIDDADALGLESANALLKTLEEPPPHSQIFLIGTSLARQLPTIRSRSQVVKFAPLSAQQVESVLRASPHDYPAEEAARMAATSSGSVGEALSLSDKSLQQAREALTECLSRPVIDPVRIAGLLEEHSKQAGTEPSVRRVRLSQMLSHAVSHFHALLRQNAASAAESDATLRSLEVCLEVEEALHRNGNQGAVIQRLVCGLRDAG